MNDQAGSEGLESIGEARVIFAAEGGPVEEAASDPRLLPPDVTNGAYRALVGSIPAGGEGPPLHRHPHTDETFYVAEGELTVVLPEREIVARPGTLVVIPKGVVHTARNSGDGPMRGIILISPGEAEHIFESPEDEPTDEAG